LEKITYWFEIRAIEKYDYILVKYKMPYYCSSMVIIYIFDCVQSAWSSGMVMAESFESQRKSKQRAQNPKLATTKKDKSN
jgi:hypothetical protein